MKNNENTPYRIESTICSEHDNDGDMPAHLRVFKVYEGNDKKSELFIRLENHSVSGKKLSLPHAKVTVVDYPTDDNGQKQNPQMTTTSLVMEKSFEKTFGNIDGVMAVYHKVSTNSKGKTEQKVKNFLDTYVFNTEESREVLHEFLNEKANEVSSAVKKFGNNNQNS